jgi:hypothetical protein
VGGTARSAIGTRTGPVKARELAIMRTREVAPPPPPSDVFTVEGPRVGQR